MKRIHYTKYEKTLLFQGKTSLCSSDIKIIVDLLEEFPFYTLVEIAEVTKIISKGKKNESD